MFITSVGLDKNEPGSPSMHLGSVRLSQEENFGTAAALKQDGSRESVHENRKFPQEQRRTNDLKSSYFVQQEADPSIRGLGFNKMTNRMLTKSDGDGFDIKVKPHNVHIGNKAMWGLTLHEDRFQ